MLRPLDKAYAKQIFVPLDRALAGAATCTFLDRITNPRGEIYDGTFAIEAETRILSGYTPEFRIILCTRALRTHVGTAAARRAAIEVRVTYVLWRAFQIAAFEPGPPVSRLGLARFPGPGVRPRRDRWIALRGRFR